MSVDQGGQRDFSGGRAGRSVCNPRPGPSIRGLSLATRGHWKQRGDRGRTTHEPRSCLWRSIVPDSLYSIRLSWYAPARLRARQTMEWRNSRSHRDRHRWSWKRACRARETSQATGTGARSMSITVQIDLQPALGPVRDQGARPTCLSLATTVAHEHARGSGASLAPEYLHYFASGNGSSDGVLFPDVARALRHPGQPAEADCPYCPGGLPPGWHPPKGVKLYRRESEPRTPDGNQIAALLDVGRVPVLGISVPRPFYSPIPPWVISAFWTL